MTDQTAHVRTMLEDITNWWPILDDVAETLLGITGHGASLTGRIHTSSTDSTTERAVIQLERIEQISIDVASLAFEWGWQPRDGHKPRFLLARLDWAINHMPADDTRERIKSIHARLGRETGHAPQPTGTHCPVPHDPPTPLLEVDDGQLHCPSCDITRTPAEIATLTRWRITTANPALTQTQTARILGIPKQTINSWIRRGHLTPTPDGHIHLQDAYAIHHRVHHCNPPQDSAY